jgi:TolA-binding protein
MWYRSIISAVVALLAWFQTTAGAAEPPPEKGDAAYYSAALLFNSRQYERALSAYEEFIANQPSHSRVNRARLTTGLCHYQLGHFDRAGALFAEVEGKLDSPAREQARFYRADCLLRTQRFDEADLAFHAAAETTVVEVKILSLAGLVESAFLSERWATAVSRAKALATVESASASPHAQRAEYQCAAALMKLSRPQDAIPVLERLLPRVKGQALEPQTAFLLGEALRMDRQLPQAAAAYTFAAGFTNTPLAVQALFRAAGVQSAAGNFDAAEVGFESLLSRPDIPTNLFEEATFGLVRMAFDRKDYDKAVRILRPLYPKYPRASDILFTQAENARLMGRTNEAISLYEEFQGMSTNDTLREKARSRSAEILLNAGIAHLADRDYAAAESSLRRLAAIPPPPDKDAAALFYLGVALARQDKWTNAVPLFERASETKGFPLGDQALYELAWCERKLRHVEKARRHYSHLLRFFPESVITDRATLELAEMEEPGTAADMDRLADLAARLPETDRELRPQALYRLGIASLGSGDLSNAVRRFEAVIHDYPGLPVAFKAAYQAGDAFLRMGNHEQAGACLSAASSNAPGNDVRDAAMLRLGESLSAAGHWPEAEKAYTAFTTDYPKSPWMARARFGLGWVAEKQKNYEYAIRQYRLALESGSKDDTSARAQFQIGQCLAALNRYDEALTEYLKADTGFAFPRWGARALLEMGSIYELTASVEHAASQYGEVVRKYPQSEEAVLAKERMESLRAKTKQPE